MEAVSSNSMASFFTKSDLGRSAITLKHAYIRIDASGRELDSIEDIRQFPLLEQVSVSNNRLTSLAPLGSLHLLRSLDASSNRLTDALAFKPEPLEDDGILPTEFSVGRNSALEEANLSHNEIDVIADLSHHRLLRQLDLSFNRLAAITGLGNLRYLQVLNLSNNGITEITGLDGFRLRHLDLSNNRIASLTNLSLQSELETLLMDNNQVSSLGGLEGCGSLMTLSIRGNAVKSLSEVEHLVAVPLLAALDLRENPVAEEEDFRLRALFRAQHLTMLDGEPVFPSDVVQANNLHGADEENRAASFAKHLPEEPFENVTPPRVDDRVGAGGESAASATPGKHDLTDCDVSDSESKLVDGDDKE